MRFPARARAPGAQIIRMGAGSTQGPPALPQCAKCAKPRIVRRPAPVGDEDKVTLPAIVGRTGQWEP
eukprot:gene17942-biopygen8370